MSFMDLKPPGKLPRSEQKREYSLEELMQLIYRAQTIDFTPKAPQPYRKPYAINWQFRVAGETYGDIPRLVRSYQAPRSVNWRFQVAKEV